MVLAEALLRVPDAATADRLIEDKLATGDWSSARREVERVAGLGLGLDARHHRPHHPARRDARHHPGEPAQAARPACRARGDAPGDAAPGLAFRARADHRGGARASRRAPRAALFLRHAGRGRPHGGRRRALSRLLCAAIDAIGATRRQRGAARPARASRSSSRRCIRASRRSRATRVLAELVPNVLALARKARDHDLNFTVDAEEADRLELTLDVIAAVLARPVAARLGGLRACRAGLSEARAGGDRLARRDRARARPPPDGAAGQGRLLGHRGQARAGARARRLSGVHPQGHDRSLLPASARASSWPRGRASIRNSPPTMRSPSRA